MKMVVVSCENCKKEFKVSFTENILIRANCDKKGVVWAEVTVFCPHCGAKYVKEMNGNEFREFIRKI